MNQAWVRMPWEKSLRTAGGPLWQVLWCYTQVALSWNGRQAFREVQVLFLNIYLSLGDLAEKFNWMEKYGSLFPPLNKKNKVIMTFEYHSSGFFSHNVNFSRNSENSGKKIVTWKLGIARKKVLKIWEEKWIVRYKFTILRKELRLPF